MVNKRMILFTKRFRSKAPSAAPLSPVQFADRQGICFISCQLFIVTQSLGERGRSLRLWLRVETDATEVKGFDRQADA